MLALSRESWKFYLAEDDNDHEWIPNPKQTGVIPGVTVTEEMVKGWTITFLDEADEILAGRKLIPFWRDAGGRGINLRRVFVEPRDFDLVLWVQGTAAAPYLEAGELTTPEVWQRLQRHLPGRVYWLRDLVQLSAAGKPMPRSAIAACHHRGSSGRASDLFQRPRRALGQRSTPRHGFPASCSTTSSISFKSFLMRSLETIAAGRAMGLVDRRWILLNDLIGTGTCWSDCSGRVG